MLTFSAAELTGWLAAFFYPFVRMLALIATAPVLSHASVPAQLKVGLALLVTVLVAPTLPQVPLAAPFSAAGVLLIAQQIIVGVAIGFAMQLVFAAVSLAGDLMGLQMGLGFAVFVDPQNSSQSPLVGTFLNVVLILLFLALDGHLVMIASLVDSFRTVPIEAGAWQGVDSLRIARAGAEIFATGLSLALPVVAALLLANVAIGMLTRAAPQLNLFAVGFPVTLGAGLLMLLLALPWLIPALERALARALALGLR